MRLESIVHNTVCVCISKSLEEKSKKEISATGDVYLTLSPKTPISSAWFAFLTYKMATIIKSYIRIMFHLQKFLILAAAIAV